MKTSKLMLGLGTLIFTLVLGYSLPIIFRNPSDSNVGVGVFLLAIWVFCLYKLLKSDNLNVNTNSKHETYTPTD